VNALFLKSGLRILESMSFTRSLYAFDFDGTLAPIVRVPETAKMKSTTAALLEELARWAPVAVISGRGLSDLKKRLDFLPPYLVGNHGLEGLKRSQTSLKQLNRSCESWRRSLKKVSLLPGMQVEDKSYSLALHFRRCRTKGKARALISEILSDLNPAPRIIPGKSVVNLLPPGAPHKGVALMEVMKEAQVKSALYIGDDDTDEDVFGMKHPSILTVRVGKKIRSDARFYLGRQSEMNRLLKTLIRFHRPEAARRGSR
jgi:trehalose 6-phosphate phosphatase